MFRIIKLALLPIKYAWIIGLVLGAGFVTGLIKVPESASAQVALDCRGEVINNQCVQQETDVCWNLDGPQAEVPDGYYIDQTQDNACIQEQEESVPQVLGESTEEPQVLAEATGK